MADKVVELRVGEICKDEAEYGVLGLFRASVVGLCKVGEAERQVTPHAAVGIEVNVGTAGSGTARKFLHRFEEHRASELARVCLGEDATDQGGQDLSFRPLAKALALGLDFGIITEVVHGRVSNGDSIADGAAQVREAVDGAGPQHHAAVLPWNQRRNPITGQNIWLTPDKKLRLRTDRNIIAHLWTPVDARA